MSSPGQSSSAQPAVSVSDLRMRYGTKDVLNGVSFEVRRGEVLALLGPNGAGKTTTIEILEGFRSRSAGDVSVLGTDPDNGNEAWRARLGVVLQSWRDHGKWTVRELLKQLRMYYEPYGNPWSVDELIDAVGLGTHANKRIQALSGGQRRRLDVAVGIVGRPELLFLDEPTVGFDPHARQEFHELIHQLSDFDHTTILLTTHDLAEAEKLSDRILILAGGVIIANGSAEELSRQVANETEVRWRFDGQMQVHSTADATAFVRKLLAEHDDGISDLEVRMPTLETTYLGMVHKFESGETEDALRHFQEANR